MVRGTKKWVRVEDSLAYRVHRLARLLRVQLLGMGRRAGVDLTPEQWFVLNKLRHRDGQSQVELGESIFADRPNMTRILQGLERREFVVRMQDEEDGRRHVVRLTDAGRDAHDRFAAMVPKERARLFAGVSDEELAQVSEVLARIEDNVKRSL
ncbi:MAG: MarR family transcriptional regulator [Myxococcota bacterium]